MTSACKRATDKFKSVKMISAPKATWSRAFAIAGTGKVEKMMAVPILIVLAVVQVAFQFYYFIHLKDKDQNMPADMLYGGV